MFPTNILTFNPPDVLSIQKELKKSGIKFIKEADHSENGYISAILADPDENQILLDQR